MSEIGELGVIYEDRRTKKQGKLIERDEKYKTLLLEASDGKSFNITFGGFKSNWRKVDEPEPTVEEAMQEVELTEEKPKKNVKPKVKDAEGILAYEDIFNSYVESLNSDKVSLKFVPAKGKKDSFVIIKVGNSKFIDLYLRVRGNFWIMMPEFIYSQTKWTVELMNVVNTPKNRREISCSIKWDDLSKFLEDIRDSFVELLSAKVEEV